MLKLSVLLSLSFCFFTVKYSFSQNIDKELYRNTISFITVNAKSGEIVQSKNPDMRINPGALTRLMTLYIIFEEIKNENISFNDKITDSSNEKHTIHDLVLQAIITDELEPPAALSTVLSSSTDSFVSIMNNKAKAFEMTNTHFANPDGSYDKQNYSTARDIANLIIKLNRDFPLYVKMFKMQYASISNKLYEKNTSVDTNVKNLLGSKTTEETNDGYGLAAWGKYDDSLIVSVVIGASDQITHDNIIAKLISNAAGDSLKIATQSKKKAKNNSSVNKFILENKELSPIQVIMTEKDPIPVDRYNNVDIEQVIKKIHKD